MTEILEHVETLVGEGFAGDLRIPRCLCERANGFAQIVRRWSGHKVIVVPDDRVVVRAEDQISVPTAKVYLDCFAGPVSAAVVLVDVRVPLLANLLDPYVERIVDGVLIWIVQDKVVILVGN